MDIQSFDMMTENSDRILKSQSKKWLEISLKFITRDISQQMKFRYTGADIIRISNAVCGKFCEYITYSQFKTICKRLAKFMNIKFQDLTIMMNEAATFFSRFASYATHDLLNLSPLLKWYDDVEAASNEVAQEMKFRYTGADIIGITNAVCGKSCDYVTYSEFKTISKRLAKFINIKFQDLNLMTNEAASFFARFASYATHELLNLSPLLKWYDDVEAASNEVAQEMKFRYTGADIIRITNGVCGKSGDYLNYSQFKTISMKLARFMNIKFQDLSVMINESAMDFLSIDIVLPVF